MRTGTVIGLAVTVIVALAAAGGVVAARAYVTRPVVESVSPGATQIVNGTTPIRVVLRSPEKVSAYTIAIDGRDVTDTATRTVNGFEVPVPDLPDGVHTAVIGLQADDLIGRSSSYRWSFTTDVTAPALQLDAAKGWSEEAEVSGVTEPGADVLVDWGDGTATATADQTGRFTLVPALDEGETQVQVLATDAAGNATTARRTARIDRERPRIRVGGVEDWTDTDHPTIYAFVDDASPTRIIARVNGQEAKTTPLTIGYTIETSRLPQGTNTISLEVTDAMGRTSTRTREFGVDSTEKLTDDLTLGLGARGNDVARLTRRLKVERVWTGKPSWTYDKRVEDAVRAYQRKAGLPEDGIARPALLSRTGGRIVVIKGNFVLNLWLDGKLARQYPIAHGMSSYPTPTGSYVVTEMLENPTWTPPNSPWAAGLEPIPPGTSNPLGTRWIGTSAPLIGIHGTPQSWSLGSQASHGCIRMLIADVEDLYEKVEVGMVVEIKD
jgi:hypothetical protein